MNILNPVFEDYFLNSSKVGKGCPCFLCSKPVEGEHELIVKLKCSPNGELFEVTEYLCNSCFAELKDANKTSC